MAKKYKNLYSFEEAGKIIDQSIKDSAEELRKSLKIKLQIKGNKSAKPQYFYV